MIYISARWYRSHVETHSRALAAPYSDAFRQHLTRPPVYRVRAEDGAIEPRETPRQASQGERGR